MGESINEYYIENEITAKVKNFDENVLHRGKSLYEVIRIIDGVPLFLESHLKRLVHSAKLINTTLWISEQEIAGYITRLIKENGNKEGNVKIVFNYSTDNMNRNFFAYYIEHHYPSSEQYKYGVSTILFHGERNNPNAKVMNNDFRMKVDMKIEEADVYEAILVDSNGFITEGSRSNIFMVLGNTVITAPIESVLPGITRDIIIDICKDNNIAFKEERISYKDLSMLEGLFISGTSPKVLPVNKVNLTNYDSVGNCIIKRIGALYDEYICDYIKAHK